MKALKSVSAFALAAVLLVSCKQNSNKQEEENMPADSTAVEQVSSNENNTNEVAGVMQTATFQVEGMSCAIGCAKMIEGKLSKMEGVKTAKVDFDSKTATVEFDDAKQNPDAMKKMVETLAKGAYKVENMQVAAQETKTEEKVSERFDK